MEKRLKVKVDAYKLGLLLQHLYGYNSVCFLKPVTSLRLPGRLNLVTISSYFENTRHFTQTKGRSLEETEAPPLKVRRSGLIAQSEHFSKKGKAAEEPLSRAVYVPVYSNNVKEKQENQVMHTNALI